CVFVCSRMFGWKRPRSYCWNAKTLGGDDDDDDSDDDDDDTDEEAEDAPGEINVSLAMQQRVKERKEAKDPKEEKRKEELRLLKEQRDAKLRELQVMRMT